MIEGLKAYRKEDGRVLLFRPEQNAQRLKIGAERMCMPSPSVEQFVEAVKQTVRANKHWVYIPASPLILPFYFLFRADFSMLRSFCWMKQVPPQGKGSLYVRPLLIGSGPVLGLCPAPEYTFLMYVCPVGNYHKVGLLFPIYVYRAFSEYKKGIIPYNHNFHELI